MFARFALRAPFWAAIVTVALAAISLAVGVFSPAPSVIGAALLVAAAALLTAVAGWHLLHRELLRRMQDDVVLQERMQRLHDAMHANLDGIFLLRAVRTGEGEIMDFEIADVNDSGAATLYRTRDQLVGRQLREALPPEVASMLFERYVDATTLRTSLVEELRVNRRMVAGGWLLHQATPTADGLAVTVRDISTRKREEMHLRRACLQDELTLLYNRRGFMKLADQHLRIARRQGKSSVVMYVDMDEFKQLNDQHGHATGDRALKAVARLLRSTVRDCDIVSRMGGDEFTIVALDADGVGARAIQKRIDEHLALLNASGELPVSLSLTVGHTRVRPSDDASLMELLARADQLMYTRKRRRHLAKGTPSRQRVRTERRPLQLPPMQIPAQVAAIARAAAMALPHASAPVTTTLTNTLPNAVPGTFIPTHAA